ncbi:aminoglycoside N(3)-acetyltransferase [Paenibacillus sp.]|uniref:aminoglycoside N(3)-acetyltransferase n=1 Tax=Paenibacillus sp. TaxID=58172 RepID=UPI003463F0F2
MEVMSGELITIGTLIKDLEALGVQPGMNLLLHSSMKSLGGWVAGGASAVILALEERLGEQGTLVMPTHTVDLSDPSTWRYPPVQESWWEPIREHMPAFDSAFTPCLEMGLIPELFRKQGGVVRSCHPQVSFAAWGSNQERIIANHSLNYSLGEQSPLARLYELNGCVMLLGVGHRNNTSIHLAEYRANYTGKQVINSKAPMLVDGVKSWVAYQDVDFNTDDFEKLGADFARDTGYVRSGKIANADALLMPVRELVDYAVQWMEENRR